MKNYYDQINLEYTETKEVTIFIKYTAIFLIIIFSFIPLAELIKELDYNQAAPYTFRGCIVDYDNSYYPLKPLQFKHLPHSIKLK